MPNIHCRVSVISAGGVRDILKYKKEVVELDFCVGDRELDWRDRR